MHVSLRQLLIHTISFIFALFNPKIYRRVFKKSSYQFISKFDTFSAQVLHLIKYSIYLFFRNFRVGVGEAFI